MIKEIDINGFKIGVERPCYIIAELSANHNHDFLKAKNLISLAKKSGADAVKLQTYTAETITLECDNPYFQIKQGPWKGQTLFELYQRAYTPWEWQKDLKHYADKIGITLFSTPFDSTAVDFLEDINVPAYKIASFELVDIPLVKYIASKGKPVIVSTGMANLAEIEEAVTTIRQEGNDQIILLKCTSDYPAKPEDMNLKTISTLSEVFNVIPGLSDHSLYNEIAIASVVLGARVIEKHFIEKHSDGGPDAHFSMEPETFSELADSVKRVEKAIGHNRFSPVNEEIKNLTFRRSLFAVKDIKKGEKLSSKNVKSIRPGYGLKPKHYESILGKHALIDIARGTPINYSLLSHKN